MPVPRFLMGAAILLAGCAGAIPPSHRQGLDPALTFAALRADPAAALGKRVAVGGEILRVAVRAQETEIEVLQYPLGPDDAPETFAPAGGRLLVRHPGFLDPAIHAPGRLVTLVGSVEGAVERSIGEARYRYPVIRAEFLYLWPRRGPAYRPVPYSVLEGQPSVLPFIIQRQ